LEEACILCRDGAEVGDGAGVQTGHYLQNISVEKLLSRYPNGYLQRIAVV
jgi:hypothetical protein